MKNIIIFGASGDSNVVLDCIEKEGKYKIVGFIDSFKQKGSIKNGYKILGSEFDLPYLVDKHNLFGGIVAIGDNWTRKVVIDRILKFIPSFNFITSYHTKTNGGMNGSLINSKAVLPNVMRNGSKTPIEETGFIHALADVQTNSIGSTTKVWQFSIILEHAIIGENCNINSHTFIENDVVVGNNVTVKCGVHLWDGSRIEDDVFIGPNVTFTNDKYPRSKEYPLEFQRVIIKKGASIGANATILGGINIGAHSMIGAGSVVSKDIPDGELWMGNPAKFIRKIQIPCLLQKQ